MDGIANIGEMQFTAAVDDANDAVQEDSSAKEPQQPKEPQESKESGDSGNPVHPKLGRTARETPGNEGDTAREPEVDVDDDITGEAGQRQPYAFFTREAGGGGMDGSANNDQGRDGCCGTGPVCGCCRTCVSSLTKIELSEIMPKVRGLHWTAGAVLVSLLSSLDHGLSYLVLLCRASPCLTITLICPCPCPLSVLPCPALSCRVLSQIKILLTAYQIVSSYPVSFDIKFPAVTFALLHALR